MLCITVYRSHISIHFCSNSELVSIELVKAYCLPLLLYAVESTAPAKQDVRMMDNDKCIDVTRKDDFQVISFCGLCSGGARAFAAREKLLFCLPTPSDRQYCYDFRTDKHIYSEVI